MIDAFARHQEACNLSPSTVRRRCTALRSFQRFLGAELDITKATTSDVEDWLHQLKSPRTRAHYRSDLICYFRWAVRRGHVTVNPMDMTDPIRIRKTMPHPLGGEAILAAIAAAENPSTRLMIMLGAYCGLRVAEIAALGSEDIHLHKRVLIVAHGKGDKSRPVPMHPALCDAMASLAPGWVFPSPMTGGHLRTEAVYWRIKSAFQKVGIDMHPHQLRASFATALAEIADGDLISVQKLMGHESPDTTMIYVQWANSRGQGLVDQLYATSA